MDLNEEKKKLLKLHKKYLKGNKENALLEIAEMFHIPVEEDRLSDYILSLVDPDFLDVSLKDNKNNTLYEARYGFLCRFYDIAVYITSNGENGESIEIMKLYREKEKDPYHLSMNVANDAYKFIFRKETGNQENKKSDTSILVIYSKDDALIKKEESLEEEENVIFYKNTFFQYDATGKEERKNEMVSSFEGNLIYETNEKDDDELNGTCFYLPNKNSKLLPNKCCNIKGNPYEFVMDDDALVHIIFNGNIEGIPNKIFITGKECGYEIKYEVLNCSSEVISSRTLTFPCHLSKDENPLISLSDYLTLNISNEFISKVSKKISYFCDKIDEMQMNVTKEKTPAFLLHNSPLDTCEKYIKENHTEICERISRENNYLTKPTKS